MATHENDWVFVDIDGNEVSEGDPASQTRYSREHFKTLDKALVFGAATAHHAPKAETKSEAEIERDAAPDEALKTSTAHAKK